MFKLNLAVLSAGIGLFVGATAALAAPTTTADDVIKSLTKSLWPVLAIVIVVIVFEKLLLEHRTGRRDSHRTSHWTGRRDSRRTSHRTGLLDAWLERRRFQAGEKWRSDRELLYWLRSMNPSEFERYIADLFNRLGYTAQAVGGSYDGGIDVIAEKNRIKNYIQCKKFITREVTVGAVRDFYGALVDRLANGQGYFITTNKFTLEARKFAEDKPMELIDGFELIRYIRLAEKTGKPAQDIKITEQKTEKCPKCGGALLERAGKFGKFLGCSNYPKCNYTENI